MRRLFVAFTVAVVGAAMVAGPAGAGDNKPKNTKKAKADIEEAYQCFLSASLGYTIEQKLACVANSDDPEFVATATELQAANAAAAGMTEVEVTKIKFVNKKSAEVTFDLIIGGDPVLPDQGGGAVYAKNSDGDKVWLVSALTLCNLFSLANPAITTSGPCADIINNDTV